MTRVLTFDNSHIERAKEIALMNYNEEREIVKALPNIDTVPDLNVFADNGLGVALFDDNEMLGFLCCYKPRDNFFFSEAKGVFSPIQAHGALCENRAKIYTKLYEAAADKWVSDKITYHAITVYANDRYAISSLFDLGFGKRCVDAVRELSDNTYKTPEGLSFLELQKGEAAKIRDLRNQLNFHLRESPSFMRFSKEHIENWLKGAQERDSRLFAAAKAGESMAYIEVTDEGENFITSAEKMKNIQGAFCAKQYRGKGVFEELLNYVMKELKSEGYTSLGVDFESFNPAANAFWLKDFKAYTNSLTRRLDECVLKY